MPAHRSSLAIAALMAASVLSAAPVQAQRAAPGNVTVTDMKGSVVVSWRGVRDAESSYRVLRTPDPRKPGTDLTKPLPYDATSYNDGPVVPGTTVFYSVVAVYRDGTEAASPPVQFTAGAAMPSAPPSARGMAGAGPLTMAPPLALRATPVTATGFSEVNLSWPPVATSVPEPVTYVVRLLKVDPATMPPGAPIGFLTGSSPKLGSNGRMFVFDYFANMERPTWYGVVATSPTQGNVTFPWYRRDPPPHRGVDAITGAYWPEGAMLSRHWVGCFTVSDVPGAALYGGHIRVGQSNWIQITAPATHVARFDTSLQPFHGLKQYFDAGGAMQIQMWPMYANTGGPAPFVSDTAHVQQVVINVPQVATPWDLTKCAP